MTTIESISPKSIALKFNEAINRQDISGLADLMTEGHSFIDRAGNVVQGKEAMIEAWRRFFELFPHYRNTFTKVESDGDQVRLYGYATWQPGGAPDYAAWTARIENDLVADWRIDEAEQGDN